MITHTLAGIVCSHPQDSVSIIGVTGRAGAGKTNYIGPQISHIAENNGFWTATLPLDAFFIFSSEDRAKWLLQGEQMGSEEAAKRRNQMQWWNFPLLEETFRKLKQNKRIVLHNVYNRADRGRLTGQINITSSAGKGGLIILEGVAIAHLPEVDTLLFVHAPPDIRFSRLRERDRYRSEEETRQRFALTEKFENDYFSQYEQRIHYWIDNSNGPRDETLPIFTNLAELMSDQ